MDTKIILKTFFDHDEQNGGSIRVGDLLLHAFSFMDVLNGLSVWFESKGRLKGEDIADHFAQQLRSGIKA